ncbi:hypothetical protein [Arcanobacterium phocae]|uniref:hypothetical protein n=1 Tax=Arcanobacterium phocae TaxID=131112 RepID=UPI001C0F152B|nr:hypothetical protein [Arcanobacterium phocae]
MSRLTKYLSAGVLLAIVNSFIVMSPDLLDGVGIGTALANNITKVVIQAIMALVIMGAGGVMREKADSGELPDGTVQNLLFFALAAALMLIAVAIAVLWR